MPELEPTGETEPGRVFGRPAKYPWNDWFNGKPWYVKRGDEFDCEVEALRVNLHIQARRRGCKVVMVVDKVEYGILFQAYPKDQDEPPKLPSLANSRASKSEDAKSCSFQGCDEMLNAHAAHLGECADFPPSADGWLSKHTGELLGW